MATTPTADAVHRPAFRPTRLPTALTMRAARRPPRFINDWISCCTVAERLYPNGNVGYRQLNGYGTVIHQHIQTPEEIRPYSENLRSQQNHIRIETAQTPG